MKGGCEVVREIRHHERGAEVHRVDDQADGVKNENGESEYLSS